MIRYICVLSLLLSPLMAYTFGTYYNFKAESNQGNGYRVATVDSDGSKFKTYVEVSLANPSTVCALVAFGAITQKTWDNSNILGLTLSPTGTVVRVHDFIGGDDEDADYSIQKEADPEDWKLVSVGIDPSYTFKTNLWRVELERSYKKTDNSTKKSYDVQPPGSQGWTPVAINIFEGACPTDQYTFKSNPIVGGWVFYSLKPTRANPSHVMLIPIFAFFCIITALY